MSLAVLSATALNACSPVEDKTSAEIAIRRFHAELNAGLTDDLWNGCDDEMKAAMGRPAFNGLINVVRSTLGAFQSGRTAEWHVRYGLGGKTVSILYNSTYEQDRAPESFVYRVRRGQAKLLSYTVTSKAFSSVEPPAKTIVE